MKMQIRLWTPYYIIVFKFICIYVSFCCSGVGVHFGQAISARPNTGNPQATGGRTGSRPVDNASALARREAT